MITSLLRPQTFLYVWHFFLFVSLQTSGPEGSLKDGARSSLQKSFRILNKAKMLENDVKGMCSIWHSDPLNRGKKCCESGMKKPYRRKSTIHYLIWNWTVYQWRRFSCFVSSHYTGIPVPSVHFLDKKAEEEGAQVFSC